MSELFNEDYLVQDASYSKVMNETVLPWLQEKERASVVSGFEGRPLYCVSYSAEKPAATVLIVHGFTENAFKYAELIWSLLHLGFSVIAYDQRGHGRSWRAEGLPTPSVTHVDRFSDYVSDLKCVCDTFLPQATAPFFLFAHSMGGAVASLFMEHYPGVFSAAVLSSPMIAPYIGAVPVFAASALGHFAQFLGKQKKNPFFMKPYSGPEDFDTSCATDPARFAWYDAIKASRTEFQNNVPSYQWSLEALKVTKQILSPGAPEKISCPVILFSADKDFSVLPGPQKEFIKRVPNGHYEFVSGSRHEIFRSVNSVLFPWWHRIISFYNDNISLLKR